MGKAFLLAHYLFLSVIAPFCFHSFTSPILYETLTGNGDIVFNTTFKAKMTIYAANTVHERMGA